MATPPTNKPQKPPDHIEQIRDIIVGPVKRQYDLIIEQLKTDFQRRQEEARTRTNELHELVRGEISTNHRSHEQGLQELAARLQQESSNVLELIKKGQVSLNQELVAGLQRMSEANAALQQELAETKTRFQSDIRMLKEQVSAELETHVSAVRDTNVSRDAMAGLLQELAMKLKGTEVLEDLKKAAKKKQGE
jgi:hypothetical protein